MTRNDVSGHPAAVVCLMAIVGLAAGCAASPALILHQPVGALLPRASSSTREGRLVVYSATRVTIADQSEYPVHTAYTIYGPGDKVVQHVTNTAGLFSQDPVAVSLPPGEYHVKALAAGSGYVVVPVVIVPRKTTVVDLDGTALPQGTSASPGSSGGGRWVRLPDGHVIGSEAACDGSNCE
jgi:hypothetical protein